MEALVVQNLCKDYDTFRLTDVSFTLEEGKIMGFVGRNGAGKTTTLKSLVNIVHPDSGMVQFWGKPFEGNELEIKQNIGFVLGGVNYYPNMKLKSITGVTRRFYHRWNDDAYRKYMELFALDENKTPAKLSDGMKVKYALALALSHEARLLILDEPTSGLDPVSRDEILEIFMDLAGEGIAILFSTHITSDLDKCADTVTYIHGGKIEDSRGLDAFLEQYKVVQFGSEGPADAVREKLIGLSKNRRGFGALVRTESLPVPGAAVRDADLDTVMVSLEKKSAPLEEAAGVPVSNKMARTGAQGKAEQRGGAAK